QDHSYKNIKGEEVSEEKALEKSKQIFNISNEDDISITRSGEGADVSFYSISYENDRKRGYMDMSVKGGLPMTLLVEREVEEPKISLNEGMEIADGFLGKFPFEQLQVIGSTQFDNIGVYS